MGNAPVSTTSYSTDIHAGDNSTLSEQLRSGISELTRRELGRWRSRGVKGAPWAGGLRLRVKAFGFGTGRDESKTLKGSPRRIPTKLASSLCREPGNPERKP